MIDLKNKVAYITGANRGIGKTIAYKLAEAGCNIAFFNRDENSAKATQKELQALGVEVIYNCGDVSNASDVEKAVANSLEKFSKIDFLINNAGITQDNLLLRMSEEQWDKVLAINLKGCFLTTKAVIKSMMRARSGKVINIGSVIGHSGNPGQINYSSSKAALVGFSKSLSLELASRNITCNLISPGFIGTEMTDSLNEQQKEEIMKKIPLGRIGSSEDIANGVLFLCSPMADYITGTTLHINGGIL